MVWKATGCLIVVLVWGLWTELSAEVKYFVHAKLYSMKRETADNEAGWGTPALIIAGRGRAAAQDLKATLARMFNAKDVQLNEVSPKVTVSPLRPSRKGKQNWPTFCHDLALRDIRYQVCMTPTEARPVKLHLRVVRVNTISDKETGYFRALRTVPASVSQGGVFSVEFQGGIDWPALLIISHGRDMYVTAYWWTLVGATSI